MSATIELPLSGGGGRVAIIDVDDAHLAEHKWFFIPNKSGNGYACRRTSGKRYKSFYLHNEVLAPPPGRQADHINHDGLDNRRANLRVATRSQNIGHTRKSSGCTSRFKGVYWYTKYQKWRAEIQVDRRRRFLGYFADETEAAKAYDAVALAAWGEFAILNLPNCEQLSITTERAS